jgi:hypothetical protein
MKRLKRLCAVTILILGVLVIFACSNSTNGGGDRTPEEILSGIDWRAMDSNEWYNWYVKNYTTWTESEYMDLMDYLQAHESELSSSSSQFFTELKGTDATTEDNPSGPGGTICGTAYTARSESVDGEPNHLHYRISDYDTAKGELSTTFGYTPSLFTVENVRYGSSLTAGSNWVVFEVVHGEYRLVKNLAGTTSGIRWNKK